MTATKEMHVIHSHIGLMEILWMVGLKLYQSVWSGSQGVSLAYWVSYRLLLASERESMRMSEGYNKSAISILCYVSPGLSIVAASFGNLPNMPRPHHWTQTTNNEIWKAHEGKIKIILEEFLYLSLESDLFFFVNWSLEQNKLILPKGQFQRMDRNGKISLLPLTFWVLRLRQGQERRSCGPWNHLLKRPLSIHELCQGRWT